MELGDEHIDNFQPIRQLVELNLNSLQKLIIRIGCIVENHDYNCPWCKKLPSVWTEEFDKFIMNLVKMTSTSKIKFHSHTIREIYFSDSTKLFGVFYKILKIKN